jgi:hypothetical protein
MQQYIGLNVELHNPSFSTMAYRGIEEEEATTLITTRYCTTSPYSFLYYRSNGHPNTRFIYKQQCTTCTKQYEHCYYCISAWIGTRNSIMRTARCRVTSLSTGRLNKYASDFVTIVTTSNTVYRLRECSAGIFYSTDEPVTESALRH